MPVLLNPSDHDAIGRVGTAAMNRDSVVRRLRDAGYRVTFPRTVVIDAVLATTGMFSADGVFAALSGHTSVGRATVFRTFDALLALAVLRFVHAEGGRQFFARATPGHMHYLICTRCHRVIEFAGCPVDQFATELAARTKFQIAGHRLEIFGLCPDCQSAEPAAASPFHRDVGTAPPLVDGVPGRVANP